MSNLDEDSQLEKENFLEDFPQPERIKTSQAADYNFRICLVGDSSVGKTSMLTRFCDRKFRDKYINTIGVDFRLVALQYHDKKTKLYIWDTAGQERFKSITLNYFKNAQGFMFIYDITNMQSFKNIAYWVETAISNNKTLSTGRQKCELINFLIGNKSDLDKVRAVSTKQGLDLAKAKNLIFFETSALSSQNIDNVFHYVNYRLVEYYDKLGIKSKEHSLSLGEDAVDITISKSKKGCSC